MTKRPNRTNFASYFDIDSLDKLLDDEHSCIKMQKSKQHVCLQPYHLNDVVDSIKTLLNADMTRYNEELGGIPVGCKNVRLGSNLGATLDESYFIHADVEADFYVFAPQVGKILRGVVDKKAGHHISCLVHGVFNVSLPKPEHEKKWIGKSVELNSEISLKITHTSFEESLPNFRGEIVGKVKASEEDESDTESTDDDETETEEQPPQKKTKRTKEVQNDSDG